MRHLILSFIQYIITLLRANHAALDPIVYPIHHHSASNPSLAPAGWKLSFWVSFGRWLAIMRAGDQHPPFFGVNNLEVTRDVAKNFAQDVVSGATKYQSRSRFARVAL